jgi:hypothetical protein
MRPVRSITIVRQVGGVPLLPNRFLHTPGLHGELVGLLSEVDDD